MLVAHGGSKACKQYHGGSGSMIYRTFVKDFESHTEPFVIGDLDASKSFVHVLDDTTLDILMSERDTIVDFTKYLSKREAFLRSGVEVISAGEEELLTFYLKNLNTEGEHDFVLPKSENKANILALVEGNWEAFQRNPQRLAQKKENEISYSWDKIIEKFAHHAVHGTQYKKSTHGLGGTETSLRFLASESRFMRRILSIAIYDMLRRTAENQRMIRIVPSDSIEGLHYVFLLFPFPKQPPNITQEEYRAVREKYLEATCMVARLNDPQIKHIVGFSTETGITSNRSEDLLYFDCANWTLEIEENAKKNQIELGILTKASQYNFHVAEYPEIEDEVPHKKTQRNNLCPCGSGLKYKKCHGK